MLNHLSELEKNLESRRLLLVVLHIAVPTALVLAPAQVKIGAKLSAVSLFGAFAPAFAALFVCVVSVYVAIAVTRCHYGNVINGSLVEYSLYGKNVETDVNWKGVSLNFYCLSVLSFLTSLFAFVRMYIEFEMSYFIQILLLTCLIATALWLFRWLHNKAVDTARSEVGRCQHNQERLYSIDNHCDITLKACVSDISVVVVMAMAIFSSVMVFQAELISLNPNEFNRSSTKILISHGPILVYVYGISAMVLSQIMIIRLRLAIALYVSKTVDEEMVKQVWRTSWIEKTHLLYQILVFLSLVLCFGLFTMGENLLLAITICALYFLVSLWLYRSMLEQGRKKYQLQ